MDQAEWLVFGAQGWSGPYTLSQLDALYREGKINEYDSVTTRKLHQFGGMGTPLRYGSIIRRHLQFEPTGTDFLSKRQDSSYTALSGANNSGKSLLLKQIKADSDAATYYIGCSRIYQNLNLSPQKVDNESYQHQHSSFMHSFYTQEFNWDDNSRPLDQIVTGLSDNNRHKLFEICSALVGGSFSIKLTDPGNSFSPPYLDVDGQPVSSNSTGTRLLLLLMSLCLDDKYTVLLIDEPEMGFSPRLQTSVAKLLIDPTQRRKYMPHLRQVFVATHSPLFLDRNNFSNNCIVTRDGLRIRTAPVANISDYNMLQFDMLGHDLESLFLPAAILIVEGKTDAAFIRAVVKARFPSRRITVVNAEGDGMENKLRILKDAFGEWERSPYKNRVLVIMDSVQSARLSRIYKFIDSSNVIIWECNGIEYLYPQNLIQEAFSCDEKSAASFNCSGNTITINGIAKSKDELCNEVMSKLTATMSLHQEIETKLIERLNQIEARIRGRS